jgi:hypothetical protein
MDHAAYQARVTTMSDDALRHTIRDAREALEAHPDNPNTGYYQDEICYCAQELQRRCQQGRNDPRAWADALLSQVEGMVFYLTGDGLTPGEARGQILAALENETFREVIRMVVRQQGGK